MRALTQRRPFRKKVSKFLDPEKDACELVQALTYGNLEHCLENNLVSAGTAELLRRKSGRAEQLQLFSCPPTPLRKRRPRPLRLRQAVEKRLPREPKLQKPAYPVLLLNRYASHVLHPFNCFRCDIRALDPIGWDGRRKPLCETCADGGAL
jgi:hypothetical protein